ncbi:MAG: hypothetical protein WCT47_06210 [Betaproteobacteria bacterium]|jgi:hypothetical protein
MKFSKRVGGIAIVLSGVMAFMMHGKCLAGYDAPALSEAAAVPDTARLAQDWGARHAAMADGLSTVLAVSAGAVERNPLFGTGPLTMLAVIGAKLGLVEIVERSEMSDGNRHQALHTLSALWSGASVNNLLMALSAQPAVALVGGIASGLWLWRRSTAAPPDAAAVVMGVAVSTPSGGLDP